MSLPPLYPLKFTPILKPTLWGGRKLRSRLHKPLPEDELIGESWEISGVKDNISEVANGPLAGQSLVTLLEDYRGALLGEQVYARFGADFPLLVKFIDANQDLSIQVHPDDTLARQRHNSFGKTEMWYVIDAEPGATLISGFNRPTSREEYRAYFQRGQLLDLLNREQVAPDDVFFLPAGRVHTIGRGLLIAEIQQTSDITYRIYDFDRVDKAGNKRQLHVEEALAAIDFSFYTDYKTAYDKQATTAELAACRYFICNRILAGQPVTRNYKHTGSFVILIFLHGQGTLECAQGNFAYTTGDTWLLPACTNEITLVPRQPGKVLEVYLPS